MERSQLLDSLRQSGEASHLKAQFRSKLIKKLRANENLFEEPVFKSRVAPKESRLLCSIVAEMLFSQKFMYTLSVFLPEGGFTMEELFTREECLRMLQISPSTEDKSIGIDSDDDDYSSGDELRNRNKQTSILHDLVLNKAYVRDALLRNQTDCSTQTAESYTILGESPSSRLQHKLGMVQYQYDALKQQQMTVPTENIEERMVKYQHECDIRAESYIKSEMQRFRTGELEFLRATERELMRRELQKLRDNLFREHQSKLAQLSKREESLDQILHRRKQELESEMYELRQKLLGDIEMANAKYKLDARYVDIEKTELEQRKLFLDQREHAIKTRDQEIGRIESELKFKYAEDVRTFRSRVLGEFNEREIEVRMKEKRVQKNLSMSELKLEELRNRENEFVTLQKSLEEARNEVKHQKELYATVQSDYSALLIKLEALEANYQQFANMSKAEEANVDDQSSLESSRPRNNSIFYEETIAALNEKLLREEQSHEEMVLKLERNYKQQIAEQQDEVLSLQHSKLSLELSADEYRVQINSLKEENTELRQLLKQARRAFDEHVREEAKPKMKVSQPVINPPSQQSHATPTQQMQTPPPQSSAVQDMRSQMLSDQVTQLQQQLMMMQMQMMRSASAIPPSPPPPPPPYSYNEGPEDGEFARVKPGARKSMRAPSHLQSHHGDKKSTPKGRASEKRRQPVMSSSSSSVSSSQLSEASSKVQRVSGEVYSESLEGNNLCESLSTSIEDKILRNIPKESAVVSKSESDSVLSVSSYNSQGEIEKADVVSVHSEKSPLLNVVDSPRSTYTTENPPEVIHIPTVEIKQTDTLKSPRSAAITSTVQVNDISKSPRSSVAIVSPTQQGETLKSPRSPVSVTHEVLTLKSPRSPMTTLKSQSLQSPGTTTAMPKSDTTLNENVMTTLEAQVDDLEFQEVDIDEMRAAEERQRKQQQERQRARQQQMLQREQELEQEALEREIAREHEENLRVEAELQRFREIEEQEQAEQLAIERAQQEENERVIEMYRQKAREKLATQNQGQEKSGSEVSVSQSSSGEATETEEELSISGALSEADSNNSESENDWRIDSD